jgi:hypothetical protein
MTSIFAGFVVFSGLSFLSIEDESGSIGQMNFISMP